MHVARNFADLLAFYSARAVYRLTFPQRKSPVRTVLVNGSPKTGTTWMRMMIAGVPGYLPGPNFIGKTERYRDARPGTVYHGHDPWTPELGALFSEMDIRVVVTVRDPRDQTVSRMFHLRRDSGHPYYEAYKDLDDGTALMAAIEGRDGHSYPGVEVMVRLTESWMRPESGACVVRYEDLLEEPAGRLLPVFSAVGIPMNRRFTRALARYFRFERMTVGREIWRRRRRPGEADPGSHFRKGISGDWRNHFRPEHRARFKELAGQTLIDWGYEKDLDW